MRVQLERSLLKMIPGHARSAALRIELGLQARAFEEVGASAQREALGDSTVLDGNRKIHASPGEKAVFSAVRDARKRKSQTGRRAQPKPRQPEHRNTCNL